MRCLRWGGSIGGVCNYKQMASINEQLLNLYQKHWQSYHSKRNRLLTRPLLIQLKDEKRYEGSTLKVMVLGQETNGWAEGGIASDFTSSPQSTMNAYTNFFSDGEEVKWRGPFWNETKRFIAMLKQAHYGKTIGYTYNNIVKIGKGQGAGFPGEEAFKIELETFNVIEEEIKILQPNLMLFFTGSYDNRIEQQLGKFDLLPLADNRNVSRITFNKNFFEDYTPTAYRTYHPRQLYKKGIGRHSLFQTILSDFEKCWLIN